MSTSSFGTFDIYTINAFVKMDLSKMRNELNKAISFIIKLVINVMTTNSKFHGSLPCESKNE